MPAAREQLIDWTGKAGPKPTPAEQDRCAVCGGQLAYFASMVTRDERRVSRTDVACSICQHPVSEEHPLVQEARRQEAERDRREEVERNRERPPTGMAGLAYSDSAQSALDLVATLRAELAALTRRVARLEQKGGR